MTSCCQSSSRAALGGGAVSPSSVAAAVPVHGGQPHEVIRLRGACSHVNTMLRRIHADGERPEREVTLADFGLEAQMVTVERFAAFVEATGYVTEAEHDRYGYVCCCGRHDALASCDTSRGSKAFHEAEVAVGVLRRKA